MTLKTIFRASVALSALTLSAGFAAAQEPTKACLITKTDINPFFVKMKEGATAKADELGVELMSFAGKIDGDHETQQQAVENCIAAGAKGILITASDTKAITGPLQQARDAGMLVIALDTPLDPLDAADATFATDNREAGRLIGAWAKGKMGDAAADARIAMLDLSATAASVDVLRDQGFLEGFGIDVKDENVIGDEDDDRIVGHDITSGNEEGGRQAMEALMQQDPGINLVYTINEPAAAGAYEALKSFGKEDDVMIVSIDGGCPGVQNVQEGVIGATAQQYPLLMASMGVEAIAAFAADGTMPETSDGLNFTNTGVNLVTDDAVDGVESVSVQEGLDACWG
ncbi:sugar ABC transporter substrate-binding protein [Paracoccus sp. JM45]|uniref:sugar ABC transporter substrate-binding protein n=1 Tax=Paracoccus sp. JM45 TaxID=2283626 RepID=UPI000E6D1E26|nr:sugar ABC transporter substrate-binding protein [Paracoccus sp. JM45]RJE79995.1 sugar ABC transporter substrate-binding protein [Paracoccus sp. JM45]